MKKIISILLSVLIISSSLLSVEVTLINNEIISGSFIKHEYEEIYLSKNKELYIIGDNAILNISYNPFEKDQPIQKINYTSYKKIRKIYKKNIWSHDPDSNLEIKSFSMNDNTIPFKYYKMMKIQFINGDIFVGRFLGESQTEIKLFTQTEKSFIKQDIQHIWLLTDRENTGKAAGGFIGGLLGVIIGSVVGGFVNFEGNKDSEATQIVLVSTALFSFTGYLIGSVSASLFEKEKLVWSRN